MDSAELDKGGYVDTSIVSLALAGAMVRVDVTPATTQSAYEHANEVRAYLVDQPAYEELAFARGSLQGYDSVRWEFLVEEDGRLLHKVDTFFTSDDGDGFAILTQAPARRYARWAKVFRRVEHSIQPTILGDPDGSGGGGSQLADFCASHACIDYFDEGVGYIVQCADGMWSHSGGRPGACSYHGGETSATFDDGDPGEYGYDSGSTHSGIDLGPGNGYTVTCNDGSISHSGGISGACSGHGGVGGN